MIRIALSVVTLLVALTASAQDLSERQRAAIQQRIHPVGEVCMQGDSSCGMPMAAASGEPRTGEQVFDAACAACHSTGAGGAPVYGDVAAWASRVTKGVDVLHQSGVKGVAGTSMIAKGGCTTCSDQEVMAAVDYMVTGSQ